MSNPELFISGFLLSLSLCLDIGIVNVALINTAIRSGMRSAMLLGLGSCFGDLFYAVLSLLGIGLLLHTDWLRWLISLAGMAAFLYLAWDAARSALRDQANAEAETGALVQIAPQHLFIRGLVLSLTSVTSILWFAAVGGSLIAQNSIQSRVGLIALFSGFFCGGFSWCLFITALSAHGGRVLGDHFRRYCNAISALLFVYFAIRVAIDLLSPH